MEVTKEWLEAILAKHARESRISKVLQIETTAAVPKGDNYGSDMVRVKADVVLSSGRKTRKSLIVKQVPTTEVRSEHTRKSGIFLREITMYRDILPAMEMFLEEIGDTSDPIWGRLINCTPYDRLVLEDLSEKGFIMVDRLKGLDLDHCKIAIRSLAKFHALSLVMLERHLIPTEIFNESVFQRDPEMIRDWYESMVNTFLSSVESTWDKEWEPILDKLRMKLVGNTFELAQEALKNDDPFKVLIHGDCWLNNMLFKYADGDDSKRPASLRFIDFQLCFLKNPAQDLHYFFNTTTSLEVRESHVDSLVMDYYAELEKQTKRFNCKTVIPSREEFLKEFDRLSMYGLMTNFVVLPFMMVEKTDEIPDMEDFSKKFIEKDPMSFQWAFRSEALNATMKVVLKNAVKKGLI